MGCPRCGGLRVEVLLEDRESTFMPCVGMQCVNCGDMLTRSLRSIVGLQ